MSLSKVIHSTNVSEWMNKSAIKLSLAQVCQKFGIDIENDQVNKIFWNINITHRVLVNEDMLNYFGYSGTFYTKNQSFRKLLHKNKNIEYAEITDTIDIRKKYVILNGIDFESLLMQMRTPKAAELRTLFSIMKLLLVKYSEYEKVYALRLAELSDMRANQVIEKLDNVAASLEYARNEIAAGEAKAAQERRAIEEKAAQERRILAQKAAEERHEIAQKALEIEHNATRERHEFAQKALEMKEKATRERLEIEARAAQKLEDEMRKREIFEEVAITKLATIQTQLQRNVFILENTIAPSVTPQPIHPSKERILGLYKTESPGEWYLMRRQKEGWKEAERKLFKRKMTFLHRWDNVSHAVDVGNMIKKHFRKHLSWDARGNKIKPKVGHAHMDDEFIVATIESILRRENSAYELAKENRNCL